jgi:hypothetical protein
VGERTGTGVCVCGFADVSWGRATYGAVCGFAVKFGPAFDFLSLFGMRKCMWGEWGDGGKMQIISRQQKHIAHSFIYFAQAHTWHP